MSTILTRNDSVEAALLDGSKKILWTGQATGRSCYLDVINFQNRSEQTLNREKFMFAHFLRLNGKDYNFSEWQWISKDCSIDLHDLKQCPLDS